MALQNYLLKQCGYAIGPLVLRIPFTPNPTGLEWEFGIL